MTTITGRRAAPAAVFLSLVLIVPLACSDPVGSGTFAASGSVTTTDGEPLPGVTIQSSGGSTTSTDAEGRWQLNGLSGPVTITAALTYWTFTPDAVTLGSALTGLNFIASAVPVQTSEIVGFGNTFQQRWQNNQLLQIIPMFQLPFPLTTLTGTRTVSDEWDLLEQLTITREQNIYVTFQSVSVELWEIEGTHFAAVARGLLLQTYEQNNMPVMIDHELEWQLKRVQDSWLITGMTLIRIQY
jgi:hypothetical protein